MWICILQHVQKMAVLPIYPFISFKSSKCRNNFKKCNTWFPRNRVLNWGWHFQTGQPISTIISLKYIQRLSSETRLSESCCPSQISPLPVLSPSSLHKRHHFPLNPTAVPIWVLLSVPLWLVGGWRGNVVCQGIMSTDTSTDNNKADCDWPVGVKGLQSLAAEAKHPQVYEAGPIVGQLLFAEKHRSDHV